MLYSMMAMRNSSDSLNFADLFDLLSLCFSMTSIYLLADVLLFFRVSCFTCVKSILIIVCLARSLEIINRNNKTKCLTV